MTTHSGILMSGVFALSLVMPEASNAGPPPRRSTQVTRTTTTVSRTGGRVAPSASRPRISQPAPIAGPNAQRGPTGHSFGPGSANSGIGRPQLMGQNQLRGPQGKPPGSFYMAGTMPHQNGGGMPSGGRGFQGGGGMPQPGSGNSAGMPNRPDFGRSGQQQNVAANRGWQSPSSGATQGSPRPFPPNGSTQGGGRPAQSNNAPQAPSQPVQQTSSGGGDSGGSFWSDIGDIAGPIIDLISWF